MGKQVSEDHWAPLSLNSRMCSINNWCRPGAVAHAYNPITLGGQGGHITEGQESETRLTNMEKPHLLKIQKKLPRHASTCLYSQLLGRLRQENRLNMGGRDFGEPRLCHFTLAWATRVKLHLKEKNKKKDIYKIVNSTTFHINFLLWANITVFH